MYATKEDLQSRFGAGTIDQLATHQDDAGPDVETVIADALADAGTVIDSYLRARYSLPLASTSSTLKRCALDLAFYNLHENHTTDLVQKRYDDWIKWLVKVNKGEVLLDAIVPPPEDGSAVPVIDGGAVEFKYARPAVMGESY